MGSKPFSISTDDLLRIARGAALAAAGAVAAYITTTVIPSLHGDDIANMALTAVFSVLANSLRLFAADTR